jgi:hypothetical protein
MATIAFDTLKLARKLEMAGFPQKQAADIAEALAESLGEGQRRRRRVEGWQSMGRLACFWVRV